MESGLNDLAGFVSRNWRRFAAAVCFLVFFFGGFLLSSVAIPMLRRTSHDPIVARRRVLVLISSSHRLFMRLMAGLGIFRSFQVVGYEPWCERPCLVVANHPSLVDIVALFSCMPRAGCIVKEDLCRHPFFGGVVRAAGYLPNDGGVRLMERARNHFRQGFSLVVFPEGSRSLPEGLRPFRRGAARIALECGVPLVPVRISMNPGFLRKGDPWYRVPEAPAEFLLEFLPEFVIPEEILRDEVPSRRTRRLTERLQAYMGTLTGQKTISASPLLGR